MGFGSTKGRTDLNEVVANGVAALGDSLPTRTLAADRGWTTGLTLVIPVYNEGANFRALWAEITSQLRSPFHALIVYDFDEDDTIPVAQEIISRGEARISLLKNEIGRGVVGAIRTGFNHAPDGPVLVVM